MPTISPVARQSIGGTPENTFQQPRLSVKAATGMSLQQENEAVPVDPETKMGQQSINVEETENKEVTLSPHDTAIARKQQKLQQDLQSFKDEKAAFEADKSDYIPKSKIKEKMHSNALETLKDLGLTYDELTELILNQQTSIDPNAQEIKKLRDEIDGIKTASEENVSKQYEATLNQYRKEIDALVESNPDYDTIKSLKKNDAVLQHIIETFEEDGQVLSVEEASKDIEDYLVEEALQMASLNKVKAKLAPVDDNEKKLPPPKPGLKTLTHEVSSAPVRTQNQSQYLSPKDRIAQAIARSQR